MAIVVTILAEAVLDQVCWATDLIVGVLFERLIVAMVV